METLADKQDIVFTVEVINPDVEAGLVGIPGPSGLSALRFALKKYLTAERMAVLTTPMPLPPPDGDVDPVEYLNEVMMTIDEKTKVITDALIDMGISIEAKAI